MKQRSSISIGLFLVGFILQPFFCCTKTDNLRHNELESKIQFNIGGQDKSYTQVTASTATVNGTKAYSFVATKDPTTDNYFNMVIMTDSLRPGTYTLASGMVQWRDGPTGGTSTNFTVTVNSNANGLINATFAGQLQAWSVSNFFLPVSNGIIENIQVN